LMCGRFHALARVMLGLMPSGYEPILKDYKTGDRDHYSALTTPVPDARRYDKSGSLRACISLDSSGFFLYLGLNRPVVH